VEFFGEFDCDLSLQRGDEKLKEYKRIQEILNQAK
jgi:hypothetical protein